MQSHKHEPEAQAEPSENALRHDVSMATRLLNSLKILEYSGHVSARLPGGTTFLIQPQDKSRADVAPSASNPPITAERSRVARLLRFAISHVDVASTRATARSPCASTAAGSGAAIRATSASSGGYASAAPRTWNTRYRASRNRRAIRSAMFVNSLTIRTEASAVSSAVASQSAFSP